MDVAINQKSVFADDNISTMYKEVWMLNEKFARDVDRGTSPSLGNNCVDVGEMANQAPLANSRVKVPPCSHQRGRTR